MSPTLPPLSPQGDTLPDIYRRQAARLEQFEKEQRRMERELRESEEKRRAAEDELDELREAKGELALLRERVRKAESKDEELEKLVRNSFVTHPPPPQKSFSFLKPLRSQI